MNDVTMETRIGILEHQVKSLMEMQTQVRETHEKIFELNVMLKAHMDIPLCPEPGKCLALDERITALEMKAAETKGGWKVGWKVATAVSVLLTSLLTWLWNNWDRFFSHTHKTP
jgi:hypothetical protein